MAEINEIIALLDGMRASSHAMQDRTHLHVAIVQSLREQAVEIKRLRAAQSMSPASAAHGEIALRWRVQDDGLYAVDMMVSNLSTEAQAHAAMAYVQSLFAGDEMAGKH